MELPQTFSVSSAMSSSTAFIREVNTAESTKKFHPEHQPSQTPSINASEKALGTRNLCAVGVLIGWIAGIACIVTGAHMIAIKAPLAPYFKGKYVGIGTRGYCFVPGLAGDGQWNMKGHHMYVLPKSVQLLITLGLNIAANILLDCMGYIHSTTLKWALIRENRLQKNSNLRLFSCAKSCFPNKWYMNAISLLSLAITYGALASLTTGMDMLTLCKLDAGTVQNIDWYESNEGPQDGLDFNGFAMVGLGIGLSLQAFVSTCSLCKSGLVGTWSSHPLTVVKVYTGISSCESKSERSLSDSKLSPQVSVSTRPISGTSHMEAITDSSHFPFPPSPTNPESLRLSSCASQEISLSFPQSRQPSMLSMLPSVCRIQYLVWAFFGAFAIWSGAVAISDSKTGRWSGYLSNTSTLEYWKKFGLADFDFSDNIQLRYQQDLVGLCIQIAVQSSITFGLHCTELVINVSRDETNWRKASTVGIATEDNSNPAKSFTTSWQSMTLMVFKSVIQWVFGYAFIADDAVDMGLLPLATMTGLFLLLAIFTEYLVRRRPKGYQPATYGDIQWMAYFIDEWDHKLLFWGDKGEIDRGIRKAGTAGHRLSDIRPDVPYVGLTME